MCLERPIVKELAEAMIAYKYVERHVRDDDETFDSLFATMDKRLAFVWVVAGDGAVIITKIMNV